MPIHFRIHPSPPVRVVTFEGAITDDVLFDSFRAAWSVPGYDQDISEIDDLSGIASFEVTMTGIHRLASLAMEIHGAAAGSRVAIYAPSDLAFGLARMYQIFTEGSPDQYAVFRDYAGACEWVGAPELAGERIVAT